ncbi:glycoside hydrolase family 3 C-terminal domain-containing protein [Pseudarthrobacter sp. NamE2]|uniref:glycoside hydrolase family 3 C-terminal domain-containing protein n=1 Tax=Pseudarthrobacter sp. NamE2 TaxID=2576838 RepID=UPI001F103854|nr:glycoside hydrolase family 3 C-terminal domain-containing protein [Pseudarthrobacter sp. NamE2]
MAIQPHHLPGWHPNEKLLLWLTALLAAVGLGILAPGPASAATPVLVRNRDGLLPLDPASLTSVAVSGHNAEEARTQGGGSATVMPKYTVSPLEGLREALPESVNVSYACGAEVAEGLQAFPRTSLHNPASNVPGMRVTFLARTARKSPVRTGRRRT